MRRWWLKLYSYLERLSSIDTNLVGSWVVRLVGNVVEVEEEGAFFPVAVVVVVVVDKGLGG